MGFREAYQRHFGGTESKTQLYLGVGLFVVGVVLGVVGIGSFLLGDVFFAAPDSGGISEDRIKFSVLLASLGFPLLFFGMQLTMPAKKAIHLVAGVGWAVCFAGTYQWNTHYGLVDRSVYFETITSIIALYAFGLAILVTTTLVSVVVNFVSKYVVLPGQEVLDPYDEFGREPTMDEILADIEREVRRQNLSWGGVTGEVDTDTIFRIKADFGEGAFVSSGKAGLVTETPLEDSNEDAYRELMKMRGRDIKESAGEDDTQDAVAALLALRQAHQVKLEQSWWYRFKRWFFTLFLGSRRQAAAPGWKNPKSEKGGKGNAGEPPKPGSGSQKSSSGAGRP